MKTGAAHTIRTFAETEADYGSLAELQSAVYPDYPFSPAEIRHDDDSWDSAKYFKTRWMLEEDGAVVGWAQLNHARHAFVATTYWLDLGVRLDARRRGHGTALYDLAVATARERGGTRLRSGTKESMADGIRFLVRRGFVESKRDWESRLDVRDFDFTPFSGARERIEADGIRISTLQEELARDRADAARKAFELTDLIHRDVPSADEPTPLDFDTWRKRTLEGPNMLNEAYFLAIDPAGRYLGLSELERSADDPTFLWQGLTGTRRDARGRGIAMALKLETVRFARERGVEHIKTWNDQRNQPMLRINEALGFVKQPAWIQFHKEL